MDIDEEEVCVAGSYMRKVGALSGWFKDWNFSIKVETQAR